MARQRRTSRPNRSHQRSRPSRSSRQSPLRHRQRRPSLARLRYHRCRSSDRRRRSLRSPPHRSRRGNVRRSPARRRSWSRHFRPLRRWSHRWTSRRRRIPRRPLLPPRFRRCRKSPCHRCPLLLPSPCFPPNRRHHLPCRCRTTRSRHSRRARAPEQRCGAATAFSVGPSQAAGTAGAVAGASCEDLPAAPCLLREKCARSRYARRRSDRDARTATSRLPDEGGDGL